MDNILAAALGDHNFANADLIASLLESESFASPVLDLPTMPSAQPGVFNLPKASDFVPTTPALANLLNPIAEDETADIGEIAKQTHLHPLPPQSGNGDNDGMAKTTKGYLASDDSIDTPDISMDTLFHEDMTDVSDNIHSAAPMSVYSDSAMSVDGMGTTESSMANISEHQSAMDISDEYTSDKQHIPPSSTAAKRKRSATVTSRNSQNSAKKAWAFLSGNAKKPKNTKKEIIEKSRGVGISRSATQARDLRAAEKDGKDVVEMAKWERWKTKIRSDDPNATFFEDDPRRVDHSRCGNPVRVKQLYDCNRWRTHLKDCKGIQKKSSQNANFIKKAAHSLFKLGFTKGEAIAKPSANPSPPDDVPTMDPCPGITEEDTELIPVYLRRSAAMGGGAKSIKEIAIQRWGKLFSRLSKKSKEEVLLIQTNQHTWRNDHVNLRVFSTACEKEVKREITTGTDRTSWPCQNCRKVLTDRRFQAVLRKKVPSDENYIYVNHRFRNQILGEQYAKNVGLRDLIENSVCANPFTMISISKTN